MAKHSKSKKPKHVSSKDGSIDLQEDEKNSGEPLSDAQTAGAGEAEKDTSEAGKSTGEAEKGAVESEAPADAEKPGKDNEAADKKASEHAKACKHGKASESDEAETIDGDDSSEAESADEGNGLETESSETEKSEKPEKPEKAEDDKPAKGGKHAADSAADESKKKSKGKKSKGKKSKGKHSASSSDKHEKPIIQSVPMPASPQEAEERAAKRRRRLKRAGIGVGAVAAVCLIAYLGGALFFATHYLPNTTVAGIDISLKSPGEMESLLNDSVDDYSMQVIGNGLNFTITSNEADISADSAAAADAVLKATNIWAWPALVFADHDLTSELSSAISAEKLSDIVNEEVAKINDAEGATLPVDAHVAYNAKSHEFEVVSETMGTKLNPEEVMNQVITGVLNLEPKVTILSDALIQPNVFSNDKRLSEAADKANEMIVANVEVMMEGFLVTKVSPDVSSSWVTFTPEIEAVFDEDKLASWADEVASMCNTIGSERTYTRPDGKEITVSGGVYGWEVDASGLADQIVEAVRLGKSTTIDIPVITSGTGFNGLGGQDWGNRYVDVDLSEQYARFYDDASNIIWEADIVSGKPGNGHGTPTGVWWVNRKASPSKLIGEMRNGKPEYETTVKYWMPFQGNSIGFHDATWQPYFGGSLYLSNGSHGCINLSYSDAQSLYGILNEGDVVVVHY